jgi:hypothetical protein
MHRRLRGRSARIHAGERPLSVAATFAELPGFFEPLAAPIRFDLDGAGGQGVQFPVLSQVAAGHATAHCENVQFANVDANAVAPA